MNIQLFNERVSLESRILQLCVRQRQWLTEERLAKLDQLIPRQQAILAEAVADRQELLDNPNRQYWRPATRINPNMHHFTQLRYLPFCVCKPDLDTALSAIISDFVTDIRDIMLSYKSAKVWLTVQVRYEIANLRDQKNKSLEFYLTCAATRFFRPEPTEGGDGASYAKPLRELFERIKH